MDSAYKALADPSRRRILELLRERDMTAGELAGKFDMAWPSVSHHLNVLKHAGLVLAERDGQTIRYSLRTTVLQDVITQMMKLAGKKRVKEGKADA
jgi:ArsR family transcriptional regulator, arsenate/arsenite/antimonite-responsive transcriptional repressor